MPDLSTTDALLGIGMMEKHERGKGSCIVRSLVWKKSMTGYQEKNYDDKVRSTERVAMEFSDSDVMSSYLAQVKSMTRRLLNSSPVSAFNIIDTANSMYNSMPKVSL